MSKRCEEPNSNGCAHVSKHAPFLKSVAVLRQQTSSEDVMLTKEKSLVYSEESPLESREVLYAVAFRPKCVQENSGVEGVRTRSGPGITK